MRVADGDPSESAQQLRSALGIDLHLLLEEIRQLRVQLVRTIDNNNSLRAKLEEQLAAHRRPAAGVGGGAANINIHHVYAAQKGTRPTEICDLQRIARVGVRLRI